MQQGERERGTLFSKRVACSCPLPSSQNELEREGHSSPNKLHALVPFPLPKMSCMLLFFPPSQKELNHSTACAQQHALSSLPLSKEKLDQTPAACALLGHKREGRGRGNVEQPKSWKKREPRAGQKQQQRKKGKKPRLEGRTIPPRPAQRLSKNMR